MIKLARITALHKATRDLHRVACALEGQGELVLAGRVARLRHAVLERFENLKKARKLHGKH